MAPGSKVVDYSYDDGLATITLLDGDRGNGIGVASVAQLLDAVRRARADRARVIVIGATGRFFCVGGDLAAMAAADDMAVFIDDLADALHRVVSEIQRSDAVVICAVQGHAAGAGFPLAAAADIVIAADTVRFSLGYTKVGLTVDGGSSLLVHTLGLHRTLRLALLGDALSAEEARDAGLVARVVPAGELEATVADVARSLLALPAVSQAVTKRLVRDAADASPEQALRRETLAIRAAASRPDGAEGVQAFLAKRPPVFTDPV